MFLNLLWDDCTALQCSPPHYIPRVGSLFMQTLVQGRKIDEEAKKDAILEIISDKYCRAILDTTMDKPKSAMEISAESKIPISTVYRRLQTLHDNKLLGISGSISDDGKKYFLYRSKVKAISSSYKGGFVEIEIVPNLLGTS